MGIESVSKCLQRHQIFASFFPIHDIEVSNLDYHWFGWFWFMNLMDYLVCILVNIHRRCNWSSEHLCPLLYCLFYNHVKIINWFAVLQLENFCNLKISVTLNWHSYNGRPFLKPVIWPALRVKLFLPQNLWVDISDTKSKSFHLR